MSVEKPQDFKKKIAKVYKDKNYEAKKAITIKKETLVYCNPNRGEEIHYQGLWKYVKFNRNYTIITDLLIFSSRT